MAIIMAHYGEGVELLGISTVFGNQTLHLTTLNALKIHYVAGLPSVCLSLFLFLPLVIYFLVDNSCSRWGTQTPLSSRTNLS